MRFQFMGLILVNRTRLENKVIADWVKTHYGAINDNLDNHNFEGVTIDADLYDGIVYFNLSTMITK